MVVLIFVIGGTLILMAKSSTPEYIKQEIILIEIRDCIWYGCDEHRVFDESEGEKDKIVLPDSLLNFPPVRSKLEEIKNFAQSCDLIYNPNGYKNDSWIAAFRSYDINTLFLGNLVLLSDKKITRKRGILEDVEKIKELKYYSIKK
jgi:hypothetical protein